MKVKVPFNLISINETPRGREIVFVYGNDFYRMDWDKVSDRFKELYVVWLKLQGKEIPEWLEECEKDTIDVSDVSVEIDLDECEKIPATYPLGV